MENKGSSSQEKYFVACCPAGYLWGVALVVIGALALLAGLNLVPAGWSRIVWPLALIGIGVVCLIGTRRLNRV